MSVRKVKISELPQLPNDAEAGEVFMAATDQKNNKSYRVPLTRYDNAKGEANEAAQAANAAAQAAVAATQEANDAVQAATEAAQAANNVVMGKLPVASASKLGGIKPGAGLTTDTDGTTRIADDANLPGKPKASDMDINEFNVPKQNSELVTKKYLNRTIGKEGASFAESNAVVYPYIFRFFGSGDMYINIPYTEGVHPVSVFVNFGTRESVHVVIRLVAANGFMSNLVEFDMPIAEEEHNRYTRVDFYRITGGSRLDSGLIFYEKKRCGYIPFNIVSTASLASESVDGEMQPQAQPQGLEAADA